MTQQGQVLKLRTTSANGEPIWAHRYRLGGRGSPPGRRGGFERGRVIRPVA